MKEILELLKNIHPEHDFSESRNFIADGLLDSFDIVNIVCEMEQRFGIIIDGEDVIPENFLNIESLSLFMEKYWESYEAKI